MNDNAYATILNCIDTLEHIRENEDDTDGINELIDDIRIATQYCIETTEEDDFNDFVIVVDNNISKLQDDNEFLQKTVLQITELLSIAADKIVELNGMVGELITRVKKLEEKQPLYHITFPPNNPTPSNPFPTNPCPFPTDPNYAPPYKIWCTTDPTSV